jgi:hypothetical protein
VAWRHWTRSSPIPGAALSLAGCNHMIDDHARHNGHADLLCERIDEVTVP